MGDDSTAMVEVDSVAETALACCLAWRLLWLIIFVFNSIAFSLNKFLSVVSKRYLSNPPFLSMVRKTAVVTLTSMNDESDSEYKFLFWTLGNQLRLVFFLEKGFFTWCVSCLLIIQLYIFYFTLLPNWMCLPPKRPRWARLKVALASA